MRRWLVALGLLVACQKKAATPDAAPAKKPAADAAARKAAAPDAAPPATPDAAPPIDAAPPDAPPPAASPFGPDAVAPVFAVGAKRYVSLTSLLDLAAIDLTWGDGPTTQAEANQIKVLIRAAPNAPAQQKGLVGVEVPAYTADGAACAARLGEFAILGYDDYTGEIATSDEAPAVLIAEVAATGCEPAVVVNDPSRRIAAPAGEPSAAEKTALLAAFAALPQRADLPGDAPEPTVQVFQAGDARLAMVSIETSADNDSGCGSEYGAARAVFAFDAAGAPVLKGATDAVEGDAPVLAVLAGDPPIVIFGNAAFDMGMSGTKQVASTLRFTTGVEVDDLAFSHYIGCD